MDACKGTCPKLLPGPRPLTMTLMFLMARSSAACKSLSAAACAATVVPFLAFFPKVPVIAPAHKEAVTLDHGPVPSVSAKMVLFRLHLMWQMGRSWNRTPSKRRLGVSSSGNMFLLARDLGGPTNFYLLPSSFLGRDAIIDLLSSALFSRHVVQSARWPLPVTATRSREVRTLANLVRDKLRLLEAARIVLKRDI
ncbi:unnamed protein product, partial [Ixodes persulcatus]